VIFVATHLIIIDAI